MRERRRWILVLLAVILSEAKNPAGFFGRQGSLRMTGVATFPENDGQLPAFAQTNDRSGTVHESRITICYT